MLPRATPPPNRNLQEASNLRWFRNQLRADNDAYLNNTTNIMTESSSPTVTKAITDKINTYNLLMQLATLQHRKRKRPTIPTFLVCVATHEGEWSRDLFSFIEEMTGLVKRRATTDTSVGFKPAQVAAEFRKRAKDRIATAVVAGFGRTLAEAGKPCLASLNSSY